jgi:hypothetical protein
MIIFNQQYQDVILTPPILRNNFEKTAITDMKRKLGANDVRHAINRRPSAGHTFN